MKHKVLMLTEAKEGGEWIATTRLIKAIKNQSKRYQFFLLTFQEKSVLNLSCFDKIFLIQKSKKYKNFGFLVGLIRDVVSAHKKILKVLLDEKIDLIITTDPILGLSAALTNRNKVIYYFHGTKSGITIQQKSINYRAKIIKLLEKFIFIMVPNIIVPSPTTIEYIKTEILPFKDKKIFTIPNIVPKDFYKNPEEKTLRSFKKIIRVKNKSKLILYSGRIAKGKGLENLLLAFPDILNKNKDITLIIAYPSKNVDPELLDKLSKNILDNSLQNRIKLLTNLSQKDLIKLNYVSDLLILPSEAEFASLSIVEALATSTPCITTNVGNAKSLLKEIDTSLLLKDNNPRSISKKVNRFFNYSNAKIKTLRAKSKKVAINYTAEKATNKFRHVLQSLNL